MKISAALITLSICAAVLYGCSTKFDEPVADSGTADVSRCVSVGGDFLSGYADDALRPHGQAHSVAALLTQQFALAGGGGFRQSLIPLTGGIGISNKPWEQIFNSASILGFKTDCNGESNFSPLNEMIGPATVYSAMQSVPDATVQDFAIPHATVNNIFDLQFGSASGSLYYHHFASNPGVTSVAQDAQAANATFAIVWTGMEDIYNYARNGGSSNNISPSATFNLLLDSLLNMLTAKGANGVIATLPDLESFPFYTTVPPRGLDLTVAQADSLNQLTGLQLYNAGENGFFIEYPKGSGNYRQMGNGEHLLLDIPLDSLKCYSLGVIQPIPDRYTLDSAEVAIIHTAINNYNSIIKSKATQYGLALTDMNVFFKSVTKGMKWNGIKLTADYIKGGFYSLDGYHPTEKSYAIIANQFIEAFNKTYHANIPLTECRDCEAFQFP
ncbi:MAG: SGNH/GDSL hydrolase family protein [Bacteroidia bacterium]